GQAVAQLLAGGAGDAAAGFGDEDVAGADVPVVERLVGVQVDVRVAAGDQGELDAGGVRLDDAGRFQRRGPARLFAGRARATLRERALRQRVHRGHLAAEHLGGI